MPGQALRQTVIKQARRIVVKVGTNAICDESGRLDRRALRALARQIADAMAGGVSVTLVASGAVGAGLAELDLPARPKTLPKLQAVAAVGQGQLMRAFHDALARRERSVAQVLLTRDDFEDRTRYLNIRNTLSALHEAGVLPILNENDAVAVDEFDLRYGDNDIIAAHVTNMLAADFLVLLTTVDGLLDDQGNVIETVEKLDAATRSLAAAERSRLGSGGMAGKLEAAGKVIAAGEAVVIANARTPNVLTKLLAGKTVGTVFLPAGKKISSRRRWIGQTAKLAGAIVIDDGAARALRERGKSLLPAGVRAIQGTFAKSDTVAILDAKGNEIARGLTNYAADELDKIKGLKTSEIAKTLGDKTYDEAIHRNNLTLS